MQILIKLQQKSFFFLKFITCINSLWPENIKSDWIKKLRPGFDLLTMKTNKKLSFYTFCNEKDVQKEKEIDKQTSWPLNVDLKLFSN